MTYEQIFKGQLHLKSALRCLAHRGAKAVELDGKIFLQWKSEDIACAADILKGRFQQLNQEFQLKKSAADNRRLGRARSSRRRRA